jgi:hypothetical protein
MTDATSKLQRLANALRAQTQAQKLRWEATDARGTFAVVLSSGSVLLSKEPRGGYALHIQDENGATIESLRASAFDVWGGPEQQEISRTLSSLYEAVRRQVLDIDKTLDSLLHELGDE